MTSFFASHCMSRFLSLTWCKEHVWARSASSCRWCHWISGWSRTVNNSFPSYWSWGSFCGVFRGGTGLPPWTPGLRGYVEPQTLTPRRFPGDNFRGLSRVPWIMNGWDPSSPVGTPCISSETPLSLLRNLNTGGTPTTVSTPGGSGSDPATPGSVASYTIAIWHINFFALFSWRPEIIVNGVK